MFNRVLVATDLTEASSRAVSTAIDVAQSLHADLIVLHVLEPPYTRRDPLRPFAGEAPTPTESLTERQVRAASEELSKQVDLALGGKAGPPIRHVVVQGVPADVIPESARDLGVDLVVTGTHGRGGLGHALLGSVAEQVVRAASCPVMTVRPLEN